MVWSGHFSLGRGRGARDSCAPQVCAWRAAHRQRRRPTQRPPPSYTWCPSATMQQTLGSANINKRYIMTQPAASTTLRQRRPPRCRSRRGAFCRTWMRSGTPPKSNADRIWAARNRRVDTGSGALPLAHATNVGGRALTWRRVAARRAGWRRRGRTSRERRSQPRAERAAALPQQLHRRRARRSHAARSTHLGDVGDAVQVLPAAHGVLCGLLRPGKKRAERGHVGRDAGEERARQRVRAQARARSTPLRDGPLQRRQRQQQRSAHATPAAAALCPCPGPARPPGSSSTAPRPAPSPASG